MSEKWRTENPRPFRARDECRLTNIFTAILNSGINRYMKAFKFRLKPTKEQETKLRQIGGGCRWLWNQMLANNQTRYQQSKKFIFGHEMCVSLPDLKKQHPWLSELPSQALQQRCWDLNNALERRFKSGFGFPRFKRKDDQADPSVFQIRLFVSKPTRNKLRYPS